MAEDRILNELLKLRDEEYRDFHARLMPTVDKKRIIGIRTPVLRQFAKMLTDGEAFFAKLPHYYYEENNLHAFLIEKIEDYDLCIREINRFLPFVDNWATCDMMRPKCFKKHRRELLGEIEGWIESGEVYSIRFGIEMLMVHFLDEDFDEAYLKRVAEVKSDEYYVNMMIAWYFATALTKRWKEALLYITENRLDVWVHNKTIQKACESLRITKEQKEYLKSFKRV